MSGLRFLLAGICLSCLIATTYASLIVALAALKGAALGAALKTKILAKSGGYGGYVSYDSPHYYRQRSYDTVPYYAVLHYHSGHGYGGGGAYGAHHGGYGGSYGAHHGSYGSGGSYSAHHSHYRHRRSTENGENNILLNTVTQLDPDKCVLKLVCLLQTKETAELSKYEGILAQMFNEGTGNEVFAQAVEIGQNKDPDSCKTSFDKCPLEDKELGTVLEKAWGCDLDED